MDMSVVGDEIAAANARWTFGGKVSESFDSHVARSVPLYREGHDLVAKVSDFFLQDGSVVYDLGCSTGELARRLAERHQGRNLRIVGVDCEAGMIAKAVEKCAAFPEVELRCGDVRELEFEPADLVVAYLTMQFIRPRFRQDVFERIHRALNWGGAFLLFEKVRGPDARFQDLLTALYTDFKLDQGYSEVEIIAKSRSLKGVLEPFSTRGNVEMLERAGFTDHMTIFKYACFECFLAIK
jgi:tRNA (cmo5U34)-methyltransferase